MISIEDPRESEIEDPRASKTKTVQKKAPSLGLSDYAKSYGEGILQNLMGGGAAAANLLKKGLSQQQIFPSLTPMGVSSAISPMVHDIPQPTIGARAKSPIAEELGEATGQIGSVFAPGGKVASLVEKGPALAKMLGVGTMAALTHPGGAKERFGSGLENALMEGGAAVIGKIAPYVSNSALGKLVERVHGRLTAQSKHMFNGTLHGTESAADIMKPETRESLNVATGKGPGVAELKRNIKMYDESPTPKKLHKLKGEVGREIGSLEKKKAVSTLTGTEKDRLYKFKKIYGKMSNDLKEGLNKFEKGRGDMYEDAVTHHRNKIVPFDKVTAVKKYLGPKGDITNAMRKALSVKERKTAEERSATEIRKLLGLKRLPLSTSVEARRFGRRFIPLGALGEMLGRQAGEEL